MHERTESFADASTKPRPAMQLHTLRRIQEPLPSTIYRVASAGYEGVEFADKFLTTDLAAVRKVLTRTDTVPVGAHVDLERLEQNPESVVDRCRRVGCRRIVLPHIQSRHFRTKERVNALAYRLNTLSDRLEADGIKLTYHTAREAFLPLVDLFRPGIPTAIPIPDGGWNYIADTFGQVFRYDATDMSGRTGFYRLVDLTTDRITFEVDVGWVAATGTDPVDIFDHLGDRLSMIHIADVTVSRRFPRAFQSTTPGDGLIDLERIVSAAYETDAEWIIFEDDDPADPEATIRQGINIISQ